MWDRLDKFKNQPLEFCPGCRLENLCGDCGIRDCAKGKKIDYCSLCNDGKPHHAKSIENLILIKDIGKEKWLKEQKQQWTCEKCNE